MVRVGDRAAAVVVAVDILRVNLFRIGGVRFLRLGRGGLVFVDSLFDSFYRNVEAGA